MIIDHLKEYSVDINKILETLSESIMYLQENEVAEPSDRMKRLASLYLTFSMFKSKKASLKPSTVEKAIKRYGMSYNGTDDKGKIKFIKFGDIGDGLEVMLSRDDLSMSSVGGKYGVRDVMGVGEHGKAVTETLTQMIRKYPEILTLAKIMAEYIRDEDATTRQSMGSIVGSQKDKDGNVIKTASGHEIPDIKTTGTIEMNPRKGITRTLKALS